MNLTINARHFEMTPAIEAYARGKFEKMWGHFDVVSVQLRLSTGDAGSKVAAADIHVKGDTIHIQERESDLYVAIDKLAHATHIALSKMKDRRSRPR